MFKVHCFPSKKYLSLEKNIIQSNFANSWFIMYFILFVITFQDFKGSGITSSVPTTDESTALVFQTTGNKISFSLK